GDLANALGATSGVLVDGRGFPADTGLAESGMVMGCEVVPAVRPPTLPLRPTAVLRVVGGLDAGLSVPLLPGRIAIGRGPGANLNLNAIDVSRSHCLVDVGPDGVVTLTDLDSLNGTDVNGVRIAGTVRVAADDLICLAGQVLLRILPPDRLGPVQHINPVRE